MGQPQRKKGENMVEKKEQCIVRDGFNGIRGMYTSGIFFGMLALMAGCIFSIPAYAKDEFRFGLMLQLPFGGSQGGSFIHFSDVRIGAKVQYADIDDSELQKEKTIDRVYQDGVLQSSTVNSEKTVVLNDGDKVSGAEAYVLVTPFNRKWYISGGINGFTGQKNIQGAIGLGYDPSFGGYLGIGALMPFSELGVRFNLRSIDYFAGLSSLSGFSQDTVWKDDKVTYNDTYNTTPTVVTSLRKDAGGN
jgi:hypothetical protein